MNKFSNCVKVQFEIGHEATLRSEVTPQGFTHDWQVFVRGVDNAEIRHFVEKVVFNLHQSFPKPKRVVKEPPYEVRESGYASFTFPIEVYLKSKDDQKKLEFIYDLTLSPTGPVRVTNCEKRILKSPSEDFKRKLLRGGGVSVGSDMLPLTDSNSQNSEDKSSSKKSVSDSSKKHKSKDLNKPEEPRASNQFADLFGTPIKTAKLSPTAAPKKSSDSKHPSDYKVSSKSSSKHSPHKEREKESTKKETMITTSSSKEKDRDKSKDKEKKSDKSSKRPPSPASIQPPVKTVREEIKKSNHEEIKDKVKSSSEVDKTEKREKKRDKKIRDEKEKRDRHKDHENKKELPAVPPPPQPPPSIDKDKDKNIEKIEKLKGDFKEFKDNLKRSPKPGKEEKQKEKAEKDIKVVETSEKSKHKHHKKKDKKKDEKDKEKLSKKIEKPPALIQVPKEPSPQHQTKWPRSPRSPSPSPKPSKNSNPISMLMSELKDTDQSEKDTDTDSSADENSKYVDKVKRTSPQPAPPPPVTAPSMRSPEQSKEEKFIKEKVKKKDKKSSFKDEDGSRKKKRKNKEIEEATPEKIPKMKEIDEPKATREESLDDDMDDRVSEPSIIASPPREDQEISRSRSPTPPPKFTEEYVLELKDLQRKIMTLEDNAELQRVVQVIAETGQYEITKKTFDFDLCALDKSTVKRLQDLFFAAS